VAGSVLQNDQTVERGTGIAITVDELNDTDADYIALGHIHKPQQVGNLPAYYAGSIYPKNFGEAHQAGFNVVEFTQAGPYGFNAKVDRVDFPHPRNLKIEKRYPNVQLTVEEISKIKEGCKVWLEITCTKEERAFISADTALATITEAGAVLGSRVTITDIPVETIRAAEITAVNTPEKKFEVWAANSSVIVDETHRKKIQQLETEIIRGSARAAGEWELVSVKLRGAIGIKKGIGKDEITINFDNYSNGLIALTGANGRGKTTLIENCHPYPQLLTRTKGTLQRHFFLRDSFREVIYRKKIFGKSVSMVKFLIQIDGQNKSGSCKYFVFENDPASSFLDCPEWTPRPGVDGNLKPYEEELNGIFGPMELYLRTAFITQRPTKNLPDLTDATAGEKKTLFVELAGIDYLQRFADGADAKSKLEEAKIHDGDIRKQMLQQAVDGKGLEEQRLKEAKTARTNAENKLADITEKGKAAKADMDQKQAAWDAEQVRRVKEVEARKAVDEITREIDGLNASTRVYMEAADNRTMYEKDIADYETLQKTVDAESQKKQKLTEANMEKQQGYLKEKSAHDEKVKALDVERYNIVNKQNSLERLVLAAENNIKMYERDAADIEELCPVCGQKLPANKLAELKTRRDQFLSKISNEKEEIKKHNTTLEEISKKITDIQDQLADLSLEQPTPVKLATFDETVLRSATERKNNINIVKVRADLEKATEAGVRIEGIKKLITEKQKLLNEKSATVQSLMVGIDDRTNIRLREELDAAITLYNELTEQYTATKAEIARQEANVEAVKRTLEEIEAKEKELKALIESLYESVKENVAWNLIAKAFGRDGIQALELDALAPGISDTANKILESAYGDRFKISIETTRIGGAGKKTKQIEDFVIKVIDSEDGEPVNLEDKSGGEAVWIKRAIYDAFAVIRKRNTNFAFLSCFQDEADGALDSESKTAYCRMLEAAYAESGLHQVIIITHSNEVKAMIDQKIDMEELAA
jgi:exonuclease SbcC